MEGDVLLDGYLKDKGVDEDIIEIVSTVAALAVPIRREFPHRVGEAGTKNKYGEHQKELDVWVNDFLTKKLLDTGAVRTVVSEELPEPVSSDSGEYTVSLDPLDGSSNIKSNNMFGTIVGVYKDKLPAKGRKQVAAFYKLYGPSTTLVITTGDGSVQEFVKGRKNHSDFLMLREDVKFPKPRIYGVGGNPDKWIPEFEVFVRLLREKGLKLRYGGSFVGDFNQVLHHGGFFGYPAMLDKPRGKLRLVFEGNPMGFIAENAGGSSSSGSLNLLDIEPRDIDERVPLYIGDKELIDDLNEIFAACKDARKYY